MKFVVLRHFFAFVITTSLALYLIPILRNIALRWGILDEPDGKIKVHENKTPYLGGIGIYTAFIAAITLVYPLQNHMLWFLLGVTFLLFVGLIDDLMVWSPLKKFLGQCLAVVCFLQGGFLLKELFFSAWLNIVVSGFWMLLVINAFNLVDVMDGLASLLALIATLSFLVIAFCSAQYTTSLLLLTFFMPLCVFFFYNKPPAKIYLGDNGALFIGGFLAAMPLFFSWSGNVDNGYIVPLVILSIPLLEVGALIVLRTSKGIPFYHGSPHHFSSYLRAKDWSVLHILFFTGLIASVLSLSSIFFLFGIFNELMYFSLLFLIFIYWLKQVYF